MNKKTINEKLKTLLTERHMSQKQLAKMTGLSEACISKYIKSDRIPCMRNLVKISRALNISITEFDTDLQEIDKNLMTYNQILISVKELRPNLTKEQRLAIMTELL